MTSRLVFSLLKTLPPLSIFFLTKFNCFLTATGLKSQVAGVPRLLILLLRFNAFSLFFLTAQDLHLFCLLFLTLIILPQSIHIFSFLANFLIMKMTSLKKKRREIYYSPNSISKQASAYAIKALFLCSLRNLILLW